MAFPGYPLAADKVNSTAAVNDHAAHHNAIAGAANNLQSQMDAVTLAATNNLNNVNASIATKVAKAGDTMTGRLRGPGLDSTSRSVFGNSGGAQLRLADTNGGQSCFIDFYGSATSIDTLNTRTGYIGYPTSCDFYIVNETTGAGCGDINLQPGGTPTAGVRVIGTPSNPSNLTVVDGQVYIGRTSTSLTGGAQLILADIGGGNSCGMNFYGGATAIASLGTRTGYFGYNAAGDITLKNEIAVAGQGNIIIDASTTGVVKLLGNTTAFANTSGALINQAMTLAAADPILNFAGIDGTTLYGQIRASATRMWIDSLGHAMDFNGGGVGIRLYPQGNAQMGILTDTVLYFGKTATNLAASGFEMGVGAASTYTGSLRSTVSDAGVQNVYCRHEGAMSATGASFIAFRAAGGSNLSDITQDGVIGTKINNCTATPVSDGRLKTILGPVPDALERVLTLSPHAVRWKTDGRLDETFIAQEVLAALGPECASGDPEGVDDDGRIVSMNLNEAHLMPVLWAAVQELAQQVADLAEHR